MYRIYNKSLDRIYKERNVKDLAELSEDDLYDVCEELKLSPVTEEKMSTWTDRRGKSRASRSFVNNKRKTIELIRASLSVSFYMGRPYWQERHFEISDDLDIDGLLEEHQNGQETFELFERAGMGASKLQPGEAIELDLSRRFVEEELKKPPYVGNARGDDILEITEIGKEKEVEEKVVEDQKDLSSPYGVMDTQQLRDLVKERNEGLDKSNRFDLRGTPKDENMIKFLEETE